MIVAPRGLTLPRNTWVLLMMRSRCGQGECGGMDTWVIIASAAAAIVLTVAIALMVAGRKRHTTGLRDQFGPEYERTVGEMGRGAAEKELATRQKRVSVLDIRPLSRDEYERFTTSWTKTQARFVDDPSAAITEADDLVSQVMKTRGYPVDDDFERRAADVSVDHPQMVDNYRGAHETALRHEKGDATTEELRLAMVKYRALFADLLETETSSEDRTGRADRVAAPGRS